MVAIDIICLPLILFNIFYYHFNILFYLFSYYSLPFEISFAVVATAVAPPEATAPAVLATDFPEFNYC